MIYYDLVCDVQEVYCQSLIHLQCVYYNSSLDYYFDGIGVRFMLAVQVSLIYRNFGMCFKECYLFHLEFLK